MPADVLTPDNLRRTYAGRVELLEELGRAVADFLRFHASLTDAVPGPP